MIHKEFTYTDETGKVEYRDEFIERVRYTHTNSRNINYKADIIELKTEGNKVITNVIYTDKWIPMDQKRKTSEIFIKDNKKWLLISSKVFVNSYLCLTSQTSLVIKFWQMNKHRSLRL